MCKCSKKDRAEGHNIMCSKSPVYLEVLKETQAKVCEDCPTGSYTQGSEHTDKCHALMDAIERAGGTV